MSTQRQKYEQLRGTAPAQGLLRMIRVGEGTAGPQGYQTMFGGGQFDTAKGWRHPDQVIRSGGYASAAAGAYQFLPGTWQEAQRALGLKSFDPVSQDLAALYLADRRGALDVLQKGGKLVDVMDKLSPEWASIPTRQGKSYYGQPVKTVGELAKAYEEGKSSYAPQTAQIEQKQTQESPQQKAQSLVDLFKAQVMTELLMPQTSPLGGLSGLIGLLGQ